MAETLSSGLTLIIPTEGDQNWATSIKGNCFQKVSEHDHTGSGKGLQIGSGAIAAGAVALSSLANIATDRLIGRDTAGTGVPESIAVNSGLEFSGAGAIQRSALTGNVTAAAGSNVTAIASGVITAAMMNLAFTSYTPVISVVGPMTFTGVTVLFAKYIQLGKLVLFALSFNGTVGGTPGAIITASLPVTAVNQGISAAVQITNGGIIVGGASTIASTTTIDLRLTTAAALTAGTVGPTVYGFYEAA